MAYFRGSELQVSRMILSSSFVPLKTAAAQIAAVMLERVSHASFAELLHQAAGRPDQVRDQAAVRGPHPQGQPLALHSVVIQALIPFC